MQNELDAVNTRNRGESLDAGREDSTAVPLPPTASTAKPRISGWEHQVLFTVLDIIVRIVKIG